MILHSFYTSVFGKNKGFFFLKGIWILVFLFGTQFSFAATNLLLTQTDTTSTETDKISKQLIYDTLPRTPLHFSEAALEKYRGDKDFDYSEGFVTRYTLMPDALALFITLGSLTTIVNYFVVYHHILAQKNRIEKEKYWTLINPHQLLIIIGPAEPKLIR